jgi:myo-inositol-1(or 4)-monophosphatase
VDGFLSSDLTLPWLGPAQALISPYTHPLSEYPGSPRRIGAEYGSSREAPALPAKMRSFERLTAHTNTGGKMVHSLRSMGSAALNICYVATGGLDLYWEIGVSVIETGRWASTDGQCWPWDVCVSVLS